MPRQDQCPAADKPQAAEGECRLLLKGVLKLKESRPNRSDVSKDSGAPLVAQRPCDEYECIPVLWCLQVKYVVKFFDA